ncbi:MAG: Wzz/FepE/Etk N-terminal domain-containing protein [bacterium]
MTTTTETIHIEPARKAWVESISLLFRHRWLIIITTLLVTAGTAVYLFGFATYWYKAEANVVPARKPGGGLLDGISAGISSTIKDLGITPLAGKSKNDGTYSPLALISSRTIQEKLIREFDLMKSYKIDNLEDALKEFSSHASADILEEGNISVGFEDPDPVLAAKVANRLVEELNSVNSKLAIEEAKFNRTFIEARYTKMIADLDSADRALGAFQKKYGVYELKSQATAQLGTLAALEQQRFATEIQLSNAEQLYGSDAAETHILKSQLEEIRTKLNDLKTGMDQNAPSYFVPMDVMPEVALDYLRLTREVEIQSKLKAFILPSYEQAKLDENRQSLLYLTLDKAIPPFHKARPKRAFTLLIAFLGSFALCSIAVVVVAGLQEARQRFRRDKAALGIE